MTSALYRARQLFQALGAQLTSADEAEVNAALTPNLRALFYKMTPDEQAHSVRVLRTLKARGEAHPDLWVAALLHDVGKTRAPLALLGRVSVVIGQTLLPTFASRWGEGEPHGWRAPFVTARQHARWGAEMCAEAGASPLATALIRRHQTPNARADSLEDKLWLALYQADSEN